MKISLLLIAALAVTLGACKSSTEPKPSRQGEAGAAAKATQSTLEMTLETDPQEVKDGKPFAARVKVTDKAGKPVTDAALHGSLVMKTMDMGKNEFEFAARGEGNYEASAKAEMAGPWEIRVTAKRGADVGQKVFPVVVKE